MSTLREYLGLSVDDFFRDRDVRKYLGLSKTKVNTIVNDAVSSATVGGIDVFLIAGQSNARGMAQGTGPGPVPQPDTLWQYYNNSLTAMTGEIGGCNGGSAWPAFGITWNRITGRKVCFVQSAVNSTGQTAIAETGSGNWSSTGGLYSQSVSWTDAALAALTAAGYTPTFKGVLWSQGENDAEAINASTLTQAQYITEFQTMIARYRTHYGSRIGFYIFKTGTRTSASDVGYNLIRQAQEKVAAQDSIDTKIVFKDAYDFVARGLMVDVVHYTQTGYNAMGETGAMNILADSTFSNKIVVVGSTSELANIDGNYTRIAYVNGTGLFKYFENGTANGVTIFAAANSGTWQLQAVADFYVSNTKQASIDFGGKLTFFGSGSGTKISQQDLNLNGANHFIDIRNLSALTSAAIGQVFRNDTGAFTQFYKAGSTNGSFQYTGGTLLRDSSGGITFCNDGSGNFCFQKAAGATTGTNTYIEFKPAQVVFKESPIAIGATANAASSMLQVDSTTKGFLPPRMTTAQKNAISSPAEGLVVYDTDLHKLYCYDGTTWQAAW